MMPDLNSLSSLAQSAQLNFTGFLSHQNVVALAEFWMPDMNFHELEQFHTIDLQELYTVPADVFSGVDPEDALSDLEQQEYSIEVGGVALPPPIVRIGDDVRGSADTALDALLQDDVHFDAVYTHGRNVRAADRFFGSTTDVPGVGNPTQPRRPLRVRAEFRMLLETLKSDLALSEAVEAADAAGDPEIRKPVDAIWGEFDVTDLLLRRIDENGQEVGTASRVVRHQFARDLINLFEAGDLFGVQSLLSSPPNDTGFQTRANRTVWRALQTCGLLEYHYVYAYNDFHRYGGFWTNEHEGDNEGCCLVFERERLLELQNGTLDAQDIAPLGLITSVHNPSNQADDVRALDSDPGDARDGLDVYVAAGSHATYTTPGNHDFFDLSDLAREEPELFALVTLGILAFAPWLLPLILIHAHFADTKDQTTEDGVTGQIEVNPASNPETHFPVELIATALSQFGQDQNIYDLSQAGNAEALALRAFKGRLGGHNSLTKKSPHWDNKTRRYFRHLVRAIDSGLFRDPVEPSPIIQ